MVDTYPCDFLCARLAVYTIEAVLKTQTAHVPPLETRADLLDSTAPSSFQSTQPLRAVDAPVLPGTKCRGCTTGLRYSTCTDAKVQPEAHAHRGSVDNAEEISDLQKYGCHYRSSSSRRRRRCCRP